MSNIGSSINNSTKLLPPPIENSNNTNENINLLAASNAIDDFEDNLDNYFSDISTNTGVNNTGVNNTGVNNTGVNNTDLNNNIIQSNNVQSNQNNSIDLLDNTLLNNNSDFEIFDKGTPLAEFEGRVIVE